MGVTRLFAYTGKPSLRAIALHSKHGSNPGVKRLISTCSAKVCLTCFKVKHFATSLRCNFSFFVNLLCHLMILYSLPGVPGGLISRRNLLILAGN